MALLDARGGGPIRKLQEPVICLSIGKLSPIIDTSKFEYPRGGAMVQRLARGPFKAEIRVRFPLALPDFPKKDSPGENEE